MDWYSFAWCYLNSSGVSKLSSFVSVGSIALALTWYAALPPPAEEVLGLPHTPFILYRRAHRRFLCLTFFLILTAVLTLLLHGFLFFTTSGVTKCQDALLSEKIPRLVLMAYIALIFAVLTLATLLYATRRRAIAAFESLPAKPKPS